jgi:hypothetical protein
VLNVVVVPLRRSGVDSPLRSKVLSLLGDTIVFVELMWLWHLPPNRGDVRSCDSLMYPQQKSCMQKNDEVTKKNRREKNPFRNACCTALIDISWKNPTTTIIPRRSYSFKAGIYQQHEGDPEWYGTWSSLGTAPCQCVKQFLNSTVADYYYLFDLMRFGVIIQPRFTTDRRRCVFWHSWPLA